MRTKATLSIKTIMAAFLIVLAFSPLANAQKAFKASKGKETYFIVQSAKNADITHNKKTNTYTVILKNVAPFVSYFSDRPYRQASSMPIGEYLELWTHKGKNSFGDNPPNADLHATSVGLSTKTINFPVELTNPVYNPENQTLQYTATPLKGTTSAPDALKYENVLLFIDQVCLVCW